MDLFNTFTIIISCVVFLGLFAYTFYIYYDKKKITYPPDIAACPDLWELNKDGTCSIPSSGVNMGNLKGKSSTLYEYKEYTGVSSLSYLQQFNDPGIISRPGRKTIGSKTLPQRTPTIPSGTVQKKVMRYSTRDIPYGYDPYNPTVINFSDKGWASYGDPYCSIKDWANINGINWDGMVSYNKC